ncbi:xanthine dehydrogenase family protein molybdopterin-binding subunit [Bradyrhizobium sp. 155]|uniref:xanthine dehydrogenase family protein molybdopterin-binding subunit n=1 Tax=Bradyrhizobium sp. 155 TaxID=2782629 RepID=UPI001FFF2FF5|nr:xanthine dehydrogenase family protein molybdopterin-binding subunit [Bradyrhizobium sp. 155]
MADNMANTTSGIGQPVSRIDGPLKVSGRAKYAAEYDAPDLLHAVVVNATITRGRIRSIDASAALALPGVIKVITHENRPHVALFCLSYLDTVAPPGRPFKPLYDAEILFDAQPIAVVLGETYEAARDGAALVTATYDVERHHTDLTSRLDKAYRPLIPRLGIPRPPKPRGDADAAFDAAPIKVEATFSHAKEHHNPMEMFATTAAWETDGSITVYDKTQGSQNVRLYLKNSLNLRMKHVRVVNAYVGGAFGSGLRPQHSVFLAVLAAKATKRSVRLMLTRAQMFGLAYRPDTIHSVSLACDADGSLQAVRHFATATTSRHENYQEVVVNWSGLLYACENVKTNHKLVKVDTVTPADMRAPGAAIGVFGLESAMDELAYAADLDPLALRLRNYIDYDQNTKLEITSKALKSCYSQGAERFGWSDRDPAPRSMREGHELVGWGIAGGVWAAEMAPLPARARATWRADGRLEITAAASDIGTGTYTILAQIAAEAFGIRVDDIEVRIGDSTLPFNPVEGGSWMAASTGAAVQKACEKLKTAIVKAARTLPGGDGLKGRDVIFADGAISLSALGKPVAITEVLRSAGHQELAAVGTNLPNLLGGRKHVGYAHSAVFAEVRVDETLGVLRVPRIVSAVGAGRILNPKTARSQIIGGVVMGIGQALHEEATTDHRLGRLMNRNFAEYHIPAHADIGQIDVIFVDEPDPLVSPLGVKGLGEIGIVGVAAAVANAVFHATGKRVRDLPITIDKIRT